MLRAHYQVTPPWGEGCCEPITRLPPPGRGMLRADNQVTPPPWGGMLRADNQVTPPGGGMLRADNQVTPPPGRDVASPLPGYPPRGAGCCEPITRLHPPGKPGCCEPITRFGVIFVVFDKTRVPVTESTVDRARASTSLTRNEQSRSCVYTSGSSGGHDL